MLSSHWATFSPQCTLPSPPGISLCSFYLQECPLWLFLPFGPPGSHLFTCQETDQAFPSPGSLLWLLVLAWDDHNTRAHVHPGTPTPKQPCFFLHWIHVFLCHISGEALPIQRLLQKPVDEITKWRVLSIMCLNCISGTSLLVQWLRACLPKQEVWVQSLVGNLKSHMLCGN